MIARVLRRAVTGRATVTQVAGAAAIVLGVALLAGIGWACIAGGVSALAFGITSEVGDGAR